MPNDAMVYAAEELHSAFVSPIRSAMLIDDKFPLYSELLVRDPAVAPADWTEVKELLRQCKERGLLCDVENRYQDTERALSKIETSDLLILDYHLVPNDDRDGRPALDILCKLADSPHANLVVVYTAAPDLEEIKRSIAASFYGVPTDQSRTDAYLQFTATDSIEFELADIEGYIRLGMPGVTTMTVKNVALRMRDLGIRGNPKEIVRQAIQDELREKMQARIADNGGFSDSAHHVNFSVAGAQRIWVSYKNVFVVVVKKAQQKNVFEELESALIEWNPSPLHLLLVHARNFLETRGFLSDWNALSDSVRQTAFVYHYLAGEDTTPEQRIKQLFRNVFGKVLDGLAEDIAHRGEALLSEYFKGAAEQAGENDEQREARRLNLAKDATRSFETHTASEVLHELNLFLSSMPFIGSHLRTGTVFKSISGTEEKFWVCVTADCSLVPRPPSDAPSWEAEIFPNVPIVALRLIPESGKSMEDGLRKATHGRCLFVHCGGKRLALKIASDEVRQPRPEVFVLSPPALVDAQTKRFSASRIRNEPPAEGQEKKLLLEESAFEVITQLRPSYSDRLLTQTGNHTTRIGVDFVNLNEGAPPKEEVTHS